MPRGKSEKSMELIAAAYQVLDAIHPASVRGVCYKLFTTRHIPSMDVRHTKRVGEQIKYAREQGIIPWEWVVDETREVEKASTWSNPDEILATAASTYRRDLWADQPYRVEVWSEKGTVRGVIQPVLTEYAVPFRVHHGFSSATAIYSAAQASASDTRPMIALYIGDHDPSGRGMSELDLPDRIQRYGGRIKLIRIAITGADAVGLPSFDAATKHKDSRYQWFLGRYGTQCVELDAMDPRDLRDRLRKSIRQYMDADLWDSGMQQEKVEQESMLMFLDSWRRQKNISGLDRK